MTVIHTHPDCLTAEARTAMLAELHHACLAYVTLRRGQESSAGSLPAARTGAGSAGLSA